MKRDADHIPAAAVATAASLPNPLPNAAVDATTNETDMLLCIPVVIFIFYSLMPQYQYHCRHRCFSCCKHVPAESRADVLVP